MSALPPRLPSDLLHGPLGAPLLRLAWPLFAGSLAQLGFAWVDTWFVGRLGADALAGVGAGMFVTWGLASLAELVSVGALALVARHVGAGRPRQAGAVALVAALLACGLGALGALSGAGLVPLILATMDLAPGPAQLGGEYLRVLLFGYPTLALFLVLEAVYRGAGHTRLPMLALMLAFLLNALLDPLLIFGLGPIPALGVAGAGWATVIARALGSALLLRGLTTGRRAEALGLAWPGRGELDLLGRAWRVVKIGAPTCAAGISFAAIYLVLTRITSQLGGTAAVAALGVGIRLEGLAYLWNASLGRAAAAMAGQNLGAAQPERARATGRRAVTLAMAGMLPLVLVMTLAPARIVELFCPGEPAVIAAGAAYLWIAAWALVPMSSEVVLDNFAGGVGDTLPAMLIEVLGTLLRIPIALGLASLGWSYQAVWWAIAGTVLLKALAFEGWFRLGRWQARQITE